MCSVENQITISNAQQMHDECLGPKTSNENKKGNPQKNEKAHKQPISSILISIFCSHFLASISADKI